MIEEQLQLTIEMFRIKAMHILNSVYLAEFNSFEATPILRQFAATHRRLIPNTAGWGSLLKGETIQLISEHAYSHKHVLLVYGT